MSVSAVLINEPLRSLFLQELPLALFVAQDSFANRSFFRSESWLVARVTDIEGDYMMERVRQRGTVAARAHRSSTEKRGI